MEAMPDSAKELYINVADRLHDTIVVRVMILNHSAPTLDAGQSLYTKLA